MTTFYDWLYLGQTQYDPDDFNKREKELAQLAWEEAQPNIPKGWKLVPMEPTREMLDAYVAQDGRFHSAREDWATMLKAAPKFGEAE